MKMLRPYDKTDFSMITITSFSISYILCEIEIFRFAQNDILPVTLNEVKGLLGVISEKLILLFGKTTSGNKLFDFFLT
jgi:hypothetical protein